MAKLTYPFFFKIDPLVIKKKMKSNKFLENLRRFMQKVSFSFLFFFFFKVQYIIQISYCIFILSFYSKNIKNLLEILKEGERILQEKTSHR